MRDSLTAPASEDAMLKPNAIAKVRNAAFGVAATIGPQGGPQAAGVKMTATEDGQLLFATQDRSRKIENLRRDPRISAVVVDEGWTVQLEGTATVAPPAECVALMDQYLAAFPEETARSASPGFLLVCVTSTWQRVTDMTAPAPSSPTA
jgi:PPOX class probable F420-dependent enzyme